ncbi:MAG: hypothetical protein ACUVX1_11970 [Chloroflexota bacterium]
MNVIIDLMKVPLLLTVSLMFVGYGVTRLLLPVCLWRWRLLVVPFIGYACLALLFRLLNTYVLTGEQCTITALALAALVNLYVLLTRRKSNAQAAWNQELAPILVSIGVYAAAVVPLVSYGFLTAIGTNGDVEQYLSGAEYVKRFALPSVASAAPNPFRDFHLFLATKYYTGDMGFTYVLSFVAAVLGWSALAAFAATIAFFLALNVLAAYTVSRAAFHLSRFASTFACLVVGLNGLLLWSAFFNFGRQIAVLSLLPLAVLALKVALQHPSRRSALFVGLLFAAVAITYWPAMLWLLVFMALFAIFTVLSRRQFRKALVVGACALLLGFLPLAGALPNFASALRAIVSSNLVAGRSVSGNPLGSEFLPIRHVFGLAYYVWPEPETAAERVGPALFGVFEAAEPIVATIAFGLGAVALWEAIRRRRWLALGLVGATAVLLSATRFTLNDSYSYFKSITFAIFVGAVLSTAGSVSVWHWLGRRGKGILGLIGRVCLSLCGVALLFLSGTNSLFVTSRFLDAPQSPFVQQYLEVGEVEELAESDAPVFLSSDPRIQGWAMGPIVYSLVPRALYGRVGTAEWYYDNAWCPASVEQGSASGSADSRPKLRAQYPAQYGVFAAAEDPVDQGFSDEHQVWTNGVLKVVGRGSTVAYLSVQPSSGGAWMTAGQPVSFVVDLPVCDVSPQTTVNGDYPRQEYDLEFQFSCVAEQKVSIHVNDWSAEHDLTPGVWRTIVPGVALPAEVGVQTDGGDALLLNWVQLHQPRGKRALTGKLADYIVLQFGSEIDGEQLVTNIKWVGPQPPKVPGWMELCVRNAAGGPEGHPIAIWPLDGNVSRARVNVRLVDGSIEIVEAGSSALTQSWQLDGGDGTRVAEVRLRFANENQPDPSLSTSLFSFTTSRGEVVDYRLEGEHRIHRYCPMESWLPARADFEGGVRLLGVTCGQNLVRSGSAVMFSLYWKVPKGFARDWRVLAELVDENGEVLGARDETLKSARSYGIESAETEVLRLDFAVPVEKVGSGGKCSIKVQMYSPVTMQMLRVNTPGQPERDYVLLDGFEVTN